jgi:superfamily II DNA/RNA helicase
MSRELKVDVHTEPLSLESIPLFQAHQNQSSNTLERHEEQEMTERQDMESLEPLPDFAMLGVRRSVRLALHEAFPNIRTPTACQTAFIPAILSRKDVILKDWTGTGK